ncbi:MAG: ATP-binding protein [Firmicutes bacterium]|nr:ATP-binding protein [Bacillota bacterium]
MALTNSQYQSIIRDYDSIRDNNRFTLDSRREQVWQAVPEYRTLEESVSSLSVSAARSMLDGETDARNRLHKALAEIKQRQRQLLTAAGFPDDYLDPIYDCPLCRDTGYITSEHGRKQKCSCFRQREISVLYSQSHIREMVAKDNFSTLSTEYYQGEDLKHFESAVDLCREFIKNFRKDYRNILFYGTVGTGKSFLSGCIAKELMDTGCSVIYFSAASLFDLFARYSFDHKEKAAFQDFCEDIYSCDLLIVDDLGTEITNAFTASQLFSCLNERFLRKRPTIISTNLSLEEIRDRYSDRIFSRITSSFALCKLTGQDIRIYKKRAQNTAMTTR